MHALLRTIRKSPILPVAGVSFVASSLIVRGVAASNMSTWSTTPYKARHQQWPYTSRDFDRQDASTDTDFYDTPRFVTHIDDAAIASLKLYYEDVLPRKGRILDFCSSWISHFPSSREEAAHAGQLQVVGLGMNHKELAANPILNGGRVLQDLNVDPTVPMTVCDTATTANLDGQPASDGLLDASTCVVSIDYLIKPVEVLKSLRERTRVGGSVHLVISNRCFPTKAISRWLEISESARLEMVGDYLYFAGWKDIEIIDLKSRDGDRQQQESSGSELQRVMQMMGMSATDPLWVVRGIK